MNQTLENFLNALEEMRKLSTEIPAVRISILVMIATSKEPVTYADIEKKLKLSKSSASRHIQALSDTDRHGKPGLGFIKTASDPNDWRRNIVVLSRTGEAMVRRFLIILNDTGGKIK
ncbi:DNA-binding MarR family transcriptional regulator [Thalassospira sp. MBR-102]|uniref:MarR family winged helix-turn-helix transcriptional regulator n=1 Tax=Thalassospira sp. MBR-102 TaxID=3156466 RepID=UPI0033978E58